MNTHGIATALKGKEEEFRSISAFRDTCSVRGRTLQPKKNTCIRSNFIFDKIPKPVLFLAFYDSLILTRCPK